MKASTRWTLAIVGLLVGCVAAQVALATAATDGKTEVIPAYYDRAIHYDDAIDQAARDRALGWHVGVAIAGGEARVHVTDAGGAPVVGRVHVTGYQRAHASERIDTELACGPDGRCRGAIRPSRIGWHDLTVTVERGRDRFVERIGVLAR